MVSLLTFGLSAYGSSAEVMDSPDDYIEASKVGERKALSKKVKSNNQVSEQAIDSPKEAARTAVKEQKKITTSQ